MIPTAPPTSSLKPVRWWEKKDKLSCTTTGAAQKLVEQHWKSSTNGNKASTGFDKSSLLVSHIVFNSTSDETTGKLASKSLYAETFCSNHKRVGKRGVVESEEAVRARNEARAAAAKNKQASSSTHIFMDHFDGSPDDDRE